MIKVLNNYHQATAAEQSQAQYAVQVSMTETIKQQEHSDIGPSAYMAKLCKKKVNEEKEIQQHRKQARDSHTANETVNLIGKNTDDRA